MTPCEELGYKVGDKFEVIEGDECVGVKKGQIIELNEDDGSNYPLFEGDCNYFLANDCNSKGAYFSLRKVKPLDKPKTAIEFVMKSEEKPKLTFGDVKPNQPFITISGLLCMKVQDDDKSFVILALGDGTPCVIHSCGEPSEEIKEILPELSEIKF